jgi:ligand-binding sensor domain-containing protein
MCKYFFIFHFSFFIPHFCAAQLPPIGQWREHLSYNQSHAVAATKEGIVCATPYALFTVNVADNTVERFNKITGLNEVGVSYMHYDAIANKTIIAYTNSNIDVLEDAKIFNIDAIKRKEITADKTIFNIFSYQDKAYLCSGLGVIVIDTKKYEVKDTYVIGNGGNSTAVQGYTTDGNFFYAATKEGLKRAPISAINLSDYRNWQLLSGFNGLSDGACINVVTLQNKIIVQKNDSLFVLSGSNWNLLYANDWKTSNVTVSENKLLLCQQKDNTGRVLVINANAQVERTLATDVLIDPRQAILLQNTVWVADAITGLWQFGNGNNPQSFQPNSPLSVATGEIAIANDVVAVAAGTVTNTWNNTLSKKGVYSFSKDEWINYSLQNKPAFDSLYDVVTVAIDPKNNNIWGGSFGGGLFEIKQDKTIQVFKRNSPVEASLSNPSNYNISGLAFDTENNLWIGNYGAVNPLAVKKSDGSWKKFALPFFINDNAVSQLIVDDYNQKWMVLPNGNGLACFNHGQTIDNPADDKWKQFKTGKNNGNLPSNEVFCIAKDKSGFIWIGSSQGVGIVQCPQEVFSSQGCEAVLPIVQQDNFAGFLFRDEQVQTIAVDGADRKWVGTKNGVWLIGADGEKILYRFTESNSALLSNNVTRIAIDGKTGEVFFSTANGICSFRSTATDGSTTNNNVLVFPNPVPPAYGGTIAIKGLVENVIVKITELNGRLVYQTRALGGQAVWNGKDYKGRTISTGVYLVLISDDSRQEKMATKIVFISK